MIIILKVKLFLIEKFIFSGGNAPSYVYRLLTEMYNTEDYDLN